MIDLSLIVVREAATLKDIEGRLNELEATGEGACIGISSIPGSAGRRTNVAVFDVGGSPPATRKLELVEIQDHAPPPSPAEVLSIGICAIAAGNVQAALCRKKN